MKVFSMTHYRSLGRSGLIVSSSSEFASWLASIKDGGNRQLRHILSNLIFPDDFERISTIRDKHAILAAFEKVPLRDVRKRDPSDIDSALKALRGRLEAETGKPIDFYEEGIVERWRQASDDTVVVPVKVPTAASVASVVQAPSQSLNTILYGPPGTGKTFETAKVSAFSASSTAFMPPGRQMAVLWM